MEDNIQISMLRRVKISAKNPFSEESSWARLFHPTLLFLKLIYFYFWIYKWEFYTFHDDDSFELHNMGICESNSLCWLFVYLTPKAALIFRLALSTSWTWHIDHKININYNNDSGE